ncbi:MAG TPA: secretin N-terminal domain-containing protein [Pseudacidobacterium sp.]|jgi:general secretion pathway protein D|nr:secretin N-terminal domain-containing protein [Pseudacidobacterium sp.]
MTCSRRPIGRFVVLLFIVSCLTQSVHATSASGYYKNGRSAEEAGDIIAAYEAYKTAFNLKPKELKYRTTYERVRAAAAAEYVKQGEKYIQANSLPAALAAFLKALDIDSTNEVAETNVRKLQDELEHKDRASETSDRPEHTSHAAPPPKLDNFVDEPITLHMVEDSRVIYQTVGKTMGINVLFDPDYVSKRVQVDLKEVTPDDALRIIGEISNTFWKPVTHNTIFVAQDNRGKRVALSQEAVQIFYLKNVSQQSDLNDVQTALRNVFQAARLFAVPSQNAIMMRGTPDELQLARMLISALDEPRPEVLVDITVMEVSRDKERNIGLSPPTSLTVNSGSSQTLNQIGRSSAYSISVGQAAVDFLLTDSDTRILQNPRLRAVDGQKATLKLGEKLPVATGSYTYATGSTSAAAETQFQYLDVGVNVEMTPAIHSNRDVTLKLSVEVSSESGTETIDGVAEPIISQEKAEQVIRLKDGETTILAGLLKQSISHSVSGWPGLGEIPGMKYLFTTQDHQVTNDELVFMIVPHIVRAPQADVTHEIDTGTEQTIQLRDVMPAPVQSEPGQHQ